MPNSDKGMIQIKPSEEAPTRHITAPGLTARQYVMTHVVAGLLSSGDHDPYESFLQAKSLADLILGGAQ